MKKYSLILTLAFLTVWPRVLSAQQIGVFNDTIRWQASGFIDKVSDVQESVPCEFITYKGKSRVDWVQGGGTTVITLAVTDTDGKWNDISDPGSVSYEVLWQGYQGKVVITRTTADIKLLFELKGLAGGDIVNEYAITQVIIN